MRPSLRALWLSALCGAACQKTITAFPEKYAGVGVELEAQAEGPRVVEVHLGSGAEKAGLAAGDVILAVDGIDTQGLTLAQVVDRLRGEDGSTVLLRYQRGDEPREAKVIRAAIKKSRGGGYRAE